MPTPARPSPAFPWRTVFFAVNFSLAVLLVVTAIGAITESVITGEAPFAFLGGLFVLFPATAVGVAEWLLYARGWRQLERPLGFLCGWVGLMTLFALVANAAEAARDDASPGPLFWLGFGSACLAAAAYGLWCGWMRVRRKTLPEPRGFAVERAASPRGNG